MDFQEEKGFTLIEILLSIVILTIILVSIMNFFPQMGLFNRHNLEKTEAINLAKKELVEWQKVDFENFLAQPSTKKISEFNRYEEPYYIFVEEQNSYTVEIWLKSKSDLHTAPTKAHEMQVKILDDNNRLLSETYGYYLYKER
ncbi:type II secretion system protein [Bacillaceae bacterium CLA-AA-H227]|uniref:Type II secretion system protein n=1 Tax=Robertmurraya yapensis (ex Hitch et al 2024) TaxID=3133160 RepID=A0ACC6SHE0_9BACI